MRSGAVSWLLDVYGMKVYTLIGGYKSFRNVILSEFHTHRKLSIIGGYTGSGKTKLLSELRSKGHHVIDLEKLANHKGSAFGHIGLGEQPSQEYFENQLAMELIKIPINEVIFLEDESIRLGHVNIPSPFFNQMSKAVVHFLHVSFEERLANILEEYGSLDKFELIQAIKRIEKRLGNQNMNIAIESIENGDIKTSFEILLKYYDRFYQKCLDKKEIISLDYIK
jgi:tRNA 2-selenouridine synthase